MIRVCHIVNMITGKSDGVYTHLKMIFEKSDKTMFQHYLIFQGRENIEKKLSALGVKVYVSNSLKKKISLRIFVDIYKIIKFNNIDIIHTHLIKPYAIAGLVNIFLRKKFIFNYHGIFLNNNPYYNFFERSIYSTVHFLIYLFRKVDAVLVPSKRSKELLTTETTLLPEPIVYYNGYSFNKNTSELNLALLKKIQDIGSDKLVIAVIGRLEVDKRIDRAIHLMKKLSVQYKNLHLFIFGDGTLHNDLKKIIDNYELQNQVEILGYVEDIRDYFKYFDVVLFTSDWEGMPLTMWEAMANEVPIVAPDVGGFKEILEENICGLIYQPANLKDAEDKILHLLDDEQLRKEIGKNGNFVIESKYNEKKFIDHIEQIYLNLLAS